MDFAAPYLTALPAAYDNDFRLPEASRDVDKYVEWAGKRLEFELALMTAVFPVQDRDAMLQAAADAVAVPYKREVLRGVLALLEGRGAAHLDVVTSVKERLCTTLEKHIVKIEGHTPLSRSVLSSLCVLHANFVALIQRCGAFFRDSCVTAQPSDAGCGLKADVLRIIFNRMTAARRNVTPVAAEAVKAAAELFLAVTGDYPAFETEYQQAFAAFYGANTCSELEMNDFRLVTVQLEFELSALPSSSSSLDATVSAHFLPTVTKAARRITPTLLAEGKHAELTHLYALAKRFTGPSAVALHEMGKALQAHIVQEGNQLLRSFEASDGSPLLVTSVVELNKKYCKLITERFDNAALFMNYHTLGFTEFLKGKEAKPSAGESASEAKTNFSEALATFLDAAIQRQPKDVVAASAEVEGLESVLTLLAFITEKDAFEELCRQNLARRVLRTPNEDLEKRVLERLQREMGKSFTRRMEGMLLDCNSSRALSKMFAQDATSASLHVEFEVLILTGAKWPAFHSENLRPPVSLQRCVDAFTLFYQECNAKRSDVKGQLKWNNTLGSATLIARFTRGTKNVTATLHQACVLVMVDEAGQLSVRALAEALGLELHALKAHIRSMCGGEFPLLQQTHAAGVKRVTAETIGDDDCFAVNPNFDYPTSSLRLPAPLPATVGKDDAASVSAAASAVADKNHQLHIDAAVVRIMKSRKTLSYAELQGTVISTLNKYFDVPPNMLKARVEELIQREYLKRRDDDPKVLEYLA